MSFSRAYIAEKCEQIALLFVLTLWPSLSFSAALSSISTWGAFTFLVLSFIFNKKKPSFPDRAACIWLGLFGAMVVLSMFISLYPKQSMRGLVKVLQQMVLFWTVFNLLIKSANQEKLKRVAFFSFFLLILDGFFQFFSGIDLIRGFSAQDSRAGWRVSASFETYGRLAAYLCTTLPFFLFSTIQIFKTSKSKVEQTFWTLLSVTGLFLLFATRSRGGMLAFLLGMIILLIARKAWKVLLFFVLSAGIFLTQLPHSMLIHLDVENKEQSIVERFELWHRALDVIGAKPLTGTGINTYAVAHQKYDTRKNWRVQNYYAHNGYLQMAAEIGIPGLIFFIAFLMRWIWIHRPQSKDNDSQIETRWGYFGGILCFLIFCLADTALHSPQPVMAFWYVMGLMGASSHRLNSNA